MVFAKNPDISKSPTGIFYIFTYLGDDGGILEKLRLFGNFFSLFTLFYSLFGI